MTAELKVRYREPLRIGGSAVVTATVVRARPPAYILAAEVVQDGRTAAVASGKFMLAGIGDR